MAPTMAEIIMTAKPTPSIINSKGDRSVIMFFACVNMLVVSVSPHVKNVPNIKFIVFF